MGKTEIDFNLLDSSPLNEYEKNLIKQIDIDGLALKEVAADLKKDDSTVSLQHKKVVEKYSAWYSKMDEKMKADLASGEEAATVFKMLEKGTKLPKIVIKTGIQPDKVKKYYEQWLELKRVDLNPNFKRSLEVIDEDLAAKLSWDFSDCLPICEIASKNGLDRETVIEYYLYHLSSGANMFDAGVRETVYEMLPEIIDKMKQGA